MAFKASNQIAADAYARIKRQAQATRQYMLSQASALGAPVSSAEVVLAVIMHCATVLAAMDGWAGTPGIGEYAKAQESAPDYDVVAEYQAMRASIVNARDTLINLFPKDGNGFLLYQTMNAQGVIAARTFTASQLSPVVSLLEAVAASIE